MLTPSLKVIARKKICFHLDDLAYIGVSEQDGSNRYYWVCLMAEPQIRDNVRLLAGQIGVSCDGYGVEYYTQELAEEEALEHLVNVHRAHGGEKLPKDRGRRRRLRKIEEWNDRRRKQVEK